MSEPNFYPLKLLSVKRETESAVCLTFDVPKELEETFNFVQGQYLTLRAILKGEDLRRSYSICAGVDDNKLQVAVKLIEGGAFSSFAFQLVAGDTLDVMPPQGNFQTPLARENKKRYLCICAGSGITPILSIIKSVFSREPLSEVSLLYGNRNSASIMFKEELSFVKNRYMDRFNWVNILSREEQDAEVLFGRIDNHKGDELARKGLISLSGVNEFFLCGPEPMISAVSRGLRANGIDESYIHYELFYASAEDAKEVVKKHHERVKQYGGQMSEVMVTVDGRSSRFYLAADGENILDAALTNGADLPFSCKGGVCATCKARIMEGKVDMDLSHALTNQEIAEGMILTCQAHPVSKKVVIDFDQ
jgi:ring-1,2-phenylacetyl-CoA epoxidase subunit PaaE